jgi:hypothetical protein
VTNARWEIQSIGLSGIGYQYQGAGYVLTVGWTNGKTALYGFPNKTGQFGTLRSFWTH